MLQVIQRVFSRHVLALAMLAALATLVTLFLFNPAENSWYPSCVISEVTGWYCPGCGTLRAGYLLLHGEVEAALSSNVLAVLFLGFYATSYLYRGIRFGAWRSFRLFKMSPVAGWVVGIIVGAFWLLRNINYEPLRWLAP